MELPDFLTRDSEGFIHLTGHRIGLASVVHHYNEGLSAEMLACEYPSIPLSLVHKVIAFYLENRVAVDDYVIGCEEEIRQQRSLAPRGPSSTELRKRMENMRRATTP
jgi:uncharacterized protein (DUF433 family)